MNDTLDRFRQKGGDIDPYEMGLIAAQLGHNTAAVHDLAKAVQKQTEATFDVQRGMAELRDGLKHANADIRTLTEKATTLDAVDARLRMVGIDPMNADTHRKNQEFLTRRRYKLEEQSSTKRHVRNVVLAAVALALVWWAWEAGMVHIKTTIVQARQYDIK